MPSDYHFSTRKVSESVREYKLAAAPAGEFALSRWLLLLLLLLLFFLGAAVAPQRLALAHLRTLGAVSALVAAVEWYVARGRVTEESLVVMRGLGVELRTRYRSGSERHRFLQHAEIADVIINEGITFQRVIFYMAFVVHDADRLVLAFEHLRPKLPVLQQIYSGAREVLGHC